MIDREKLATMRFWSKVNVKSSTTECWEWKACKSGNRDYGTFWYHGRMETSHRVAWKLYNNKDIPEKMEVCHKCDNPICCNPLHLFLGTHEDNMHDMVKKGRSSGRKAAAFC